MGGGVGWSGAGGGSGGGWGNNHDLLSLCACYLGLMLPVIFGYLGCPGKL